MTFSPFCESGQVAREALDARRAQICAERRRIDRDCASQPKIVRLSTAFADELHVSAA
jgi:hypothetical protein